MLVASSLRGLTSENNDNQETVEVINMDDLSDFSTGSLLGSIDFDQLFAGLDDDDDDDPDHVLSDLEIRGDGTTGDDQGLSSDEVGLDGNDVVSASGQDRSSICSLSEGVVDKAGEVIDVNKEKKSGTPAGKAGRSKTRCSDRKRKVKVDWTPELHKRFVQAVEQLGEKAVPSRILEIMATHGLTRHNIASHLQKYRSHRKHLIAREAEAACWKQRRHIGGTGKRVVSTITIGFPSPCTSMPTQHVHHHSLIIPLHVWGHPFSVNHTQTASNMWSKHVVPHHLRPHHLQPRPVCAPPPSQVMPPPSQRFVAHNALYKNTAGHLPSQICSTPSNERIDAALGDVLAKPWLPLPIGLKPPAVDTVVGELQRRGVPQIPPSRFDKL